MNDIEPTSGSRVIQNSWVCGVLICWHDDFSCMIYHHFCRLTLDEIAAAAEMILAQDGTEEKENMESSDEGFGGEVESDAEDLDGMEDLGDSGFSTACVSMETNSALDEMGADALLCLATGSRGASPPAVA